MFDFIAARYSAYDLDKFYRLTLRQIVYLKNAAESGKRKEFELEASLHNKEIKKHVEPLKIDTPQRKRFDADANDLLQRMKMKHLEETIKNGSRSRTTNKDIGKS